LLGRIIDAGTGQMENEDVNKTDLRGVCAGHICAIHKLKFQNIWVEGE